MRRVVIVFVVIPIILLVAAGAALAVTERFVAKLTGAQEVPPASTTAEGKARFTKVCNTKMTYTLTASNIENVSGGTSTLPLGEKTAQ